MMICVLNCYRKSKDHQICQTGGDQVSMTKLCAQMVEILEGHKGLGFNQGVVSLVVDKAQVKDLKWQGRKICSQVSMVASKRVIVIIVISLVI